MIYTLSSLLINIASTLSKLSTNFNPSSIPLAKTVVERASASIDLSVIMLTPAMLLSKGYPVLGFKR